MSDDCIFCRIVREEAPASRVYEDEDVIAFLDTRPVNTGHLLVIPRRHASSLSELDPGDGAKIFQVAQRLSAAVRKSGVRCEGINLRLNDGHAAGQRVFHVHLHVIPRHSDDVFSRFTPPPFNDDPPWELMNGIAQAIRDNIE